jgi:hypothetical protein
MGQKTAKTAETPSSAATNPSLSPAKSPSYSNPTTKSASKPPVAAAGTNQNEIGRPFRKRGQDSSHLKIGEFNEKTNHHLLRTQPLGQPKLV